MTAEKPQPSSEDIRSVYVTHPERLQDLRHELNEKTARIAEPLLFSKNPPRAAVWALDVWQEPLVIPITSIAHAAKTLRGLGKLWHCVPIGHFRRAALIQEQLPKVKIPVIAFPDKPKLPPIGGWTLSDPNTLVCSAKRWNVWPGGQIPLAEDKDTPPNRAYLKLWDIFTLMNDRPGTGQKCLDLGASPGGWTWVLQKLGSSVTAIDKAPLDVKISKLPRVSYQEGSAFALDPKDFGVIDWLCCDVICYPDRLFKMLERWHAAGTAKNMVITIKLQGETDFAAVKRFQELPGNVIHLDHNKHELTYVFPYRRELDAASSPPLSPKGISFGA